MMVVLSAMANERTLQFLVMMIIDVVEVLDMKAVFTEIEIYILRMMVLMHS